MNRIDVKKVQLIEALEDASRRDDGRGVLVSQVMTRGPSLINDDSTAFDLARMFHSKRFRHLLVCDDRGLLAGIVSDRDLIGCFSPINPPSKEELETIPTRSLMSTDLLTVGPEVTLTHAVQVMLKHGVNCLPVVEGGRVLGILTSTDLQVLLQVFLEEAQSERPESSLAHALNS